MFNKKGASIILMIFEILVVLLAVYSAVGVAQSYGSSDFVFRVNTAEDLRMMVDTLVGVNGDAVIKYPHAEVSIFTITLEQGSVTVFKKGTPKVKWVPRNFFLPQGWSAEGFVEEKENVCLEKRGKKITLRECREDDLTETPIGTSSRTSAGKPDLSQFSTSAEFKEWLKQASKEEKIALLSKGGRRSSTEFIILHDGGRYGKFATGFNSLLNDWGMRNAYLERLDECSSLDGEDYTTKPLCFKTSVSSHYYIDCDGTVNALVPEELVAYHAGCNSEKANCFLPGINKKSIGIDLRNCNLASNTYITNKQYISLNSLLDTLEIRYPGVRKDDDHVMGHFEVYGGHDDPLPEFDWSRIGLVDHRGSEYCQRHPQKGMCSKKYPLVS